MAQVPSGPADRAGGQPALARWAPLAFSLLFVAGILLRAGTSPVDVLRYLAYAGLTIVAPGTLVYRALRGRPHTLVEDLAMGAAVGLCLEIGAWALFSVLDLRGWVWLWPALVLVPFAAVPALRRHWLVREYRRQAPLAWSWTVAGVVCFFTAYLAMVFLDRNPILPTSDATLQYLDLPYQLSLAGEAKHNFPVDLPQVAGDPLYYHWFAYGHMAMTSLVGHIDLPVVSLRLAIPALCALSIVLTGVVGWRVSNRPAVGAVAAVLFFGVGEFNFTNPVTAPFATQVTFVIWHGMSMIYSWALLIALIAPLAEIIRRRASPGDGVPAMGAGAFGLATILLFGSSGAKASTLPVVIAALAFTAVVLLITQRRIHRGVVVVGLIAIAAQVFATAALYHFHTYGVELGPLRGLSRYWGQTVDRPEWLVVLGVCVAFLINMQLRAAGIVSLLWIRRLALTPVQWLLVGGGIAGPAIYLIFSQPSGGNEYFTRSGFTFAVIASAWGFVELYQRAGLTRRSGVPLGIGAAVFAVVLIWVQLAVAPPQPPGDSFAPLVPLLRWALALAIVALVAGIGWRLAGRWYPALRGRGGLVLLTAVLVAGAPGLVMDEAKSVKAPNGGAYAVVPLPKSRVDAARFVRDHSQPTDVVATNVHCLAYYGDICDPRSFWLSAYAERSVLVEGWGFAPRQATDLFAPFWDPQRLRLNDEAFAAPTPALLAQLRAQHHVRYLVVDREVSAESPLLASYAAKVYDSGRMAVYELR